MSVETEVSEVIQGKFESHSLEENQNSERSPQIRYKKGTGEDQEKPECGSKLIIIKSFKCRGY